MNLKQLRSALALCLLALPACGARAQLVISDTLTGASSSYSWQSIGGACLTAGNNSGSIPACVGLSYYKGTTQVGGVNGLLGSSGDPVGQGALRLTNGDTTTGTNGNNQAGAVISTFSFPSNQGVQVTFQTVTYGGNADSNTGGQKSGADGIAFFLIDADKVPTIGATTKTGAVGGSLGYSCSNTNAPYDGLQGAYIGVGIDEFGNFSNPGDNSASGPGTGPSRVTLRGAGNVNWASLNAAYPTLYPGTLNAADRLAAVKATCGSGKLYNYSGGKITDTNGKKVANQGQTVQSVLTYPFIADSDLSALNTTIYSQEAVAKPLRSKATPITYGLTITQDGLLSLSYSVNGGAPTSVISKQAITASNGPLPSAFHFGFSAGTGGGSNVHEIMCFKAAPIDTAASSAGINIQQSAKVQVGTQLYLAYYHPTNWWGQLTAQNLVLDPTTDIVSINPVANWDASCVLTGGSCSATGGSNTAQNSTQRSILSWNGGAGIPLAWSSLSSTEKTALDATTSTTVSTRLNYLRGDRGNEIKTGGSGTFRVRNGVLGDIVNSGPTWVGAPALPYKQNWGDALYPTTAMPEGSTSYATFASNNATRANVVYIGANDGLLHGFRAGAYDASGNFDSTAANDGKELLAYMPAAAVSSIHSSSTAALDYSSPQYAHNAFVDSTPGTGDLYYAGNWHTWVVGGLGDGGNPGGVIGDATSIATGDLYALDVTTPANFSEANAASLVLGEWDSNSLACTGDTGSAKCRTSLGSVYGTPIIRRMHDGNWAVIFGNGLNSSSGKAGIFIMTVDQNSGAKTFRFLDTGSGPTTNSKTGAVTARNGIAYVTSGDLDGDHVIDYLYAGDVFGNVWRFDVTSATASNWAARSTPIFSTGGLPITTSLAVTATGAAGAPRLIVSFGTGQILPQTLTSAATPTVGTQALFGIWDWDMAGWNGKGSTPYASLAGPQTVSTATLQPQTATTVAYASGNISGVRTVTQNPVCWKGSTTCSSNNTQFGWALALPGASEQVVYNPVVSDGLLLVNTTLPAVSQTLSCNVQAASGFTMAITPDTGAAPVSSYFGNATNNFISANGMIVAGIGLSGVGSPSIVSANTKKYLATQTVGGSGSVTQVNPGANGNGQRLNWIQLR
jgi:type IV pilus assembly protein PilY1